MSKSDSLYERIKEPDLDIYVKKYIEVGFDPYEDMRIMDDMSFSRYTNDYEKWDEILHTPLPTEMEVIPAPALPKAPRNIIGLSDILSSYGGGNHPFGGNVAVPHYYESHSDMQTFISGIGAIDMSWKPFEFSSFPMFQNTSEAVKKLAQLPANFFANTSAIMQKAMSLPTYTAIVEKLVYPAFQKPAIDPMAMLQFTVGTMKTALDQFKDMITDAKISEVQKAYDKLVADVKFITDKIGGLKILDAIDVVKKEGEVVKDIADWAKLFFRMSMDSFKKLGSFGNEVIQGFTNLPGLIEKKLGELLAKLQKGIMDTIGIVKTTADAFTGKMKEQLDKIVSGIKSYVESITSAVKDWVSSVVGAIKTDVTNLAMWIKDCMSGIGSAVVKDFTNVKDWIVGNMTGLSTNIRDNVRNLATQLQTEIMSQVTAFQTRIATVKDELTATFNTTIANAQTKLQDYTKGLTDQFQGKLDSISSSMSNQFSAFSNKLSSATDRVTALVDNVTKMADLVNTIQAQVKSYGSRIQSLESKMSIPSIAPSTPSAPAEEKKGGFSLWGLGEALVTPYTAEKPFYTPILSGQKKMPRFVGYEP